MIRCPLCKRTHETTPPERCYCGHAGPFEREDYKQPDTQPSLSRVSDYAPDGAW